MLDMAGNEDSTLSENDFSAHYEAMLDHRRQLDELRVDQLQTADKAKLALSTGAISVSLLLLQWVDAKEAEVVSLNALAASWTMLGLTIIMNLFSYQTSVWDAEREIAKIDQQISTGTLTADTTNTSRNLTNALNIVSIVTFVVGVVLMFWFAYSNVRNP